MYFAALAAGETDASLQQLLTSCNVRCAMIDPLIAGLPGALSPDKVARRFRSTFEHGEEDCFRAAVALGAPLLNVAHYLGASTPVEVLSEAIGGLAARGSRHGVGVLVEFMPEGGIGDLATAAAVVAGTGSADVQLLIDTWHLWRTSGSVEALAQLPASMIGAVQLADAPASFLGCGANPPSADRLLPGDGAVPLDAILAVARANNPNVVVGIEVFNRSTVDDPASDRAGAAMQALSGLRYA